MHTIFWLENLKGKDHSKEASLDGRIILKWILRKYDGKGWTGCIWITVETSDGLL